LQGGLLAQTNTVYPLHMALPDCMSQRPSSAMNQDLLFDPDEPESSYFHDNFLGHDVAIPSNQADDLRFNDDDTLNTHVNNLLEPQSLRQANGFQPPDTPAVTAASCTVRGPPTPAPFTNPSSLALWSTVESSIANEYPVSDPRRTFVEARAASDTRSLSTQEKRLQASINYFLQRSQTEQSEYQGEGSLAAVSHAAGPSGLYGTSLHDVDPASSNRISANAAVQNRIDFSDRVPSHPSQFPKSESTTQPRHSSQDSTDSEPATRKTFEPKSFESVWTSTFEPHEVRRMLPKTKRQREAYNAVRKNGGACEKHKRLKKAVSILAP
jgi:hypothetical protein